MCILFFNVKNNSKLDEYPLVLINNRDEIYNRPTQVSHFWKECPRVLSGRDATPGKEGGTWLGISKSGKIGVLLNVLQPKGEENALAKGRGSLVSDFLKTDIGSKEYFDTIVKEKHHYNNFNLITMEFRQPFREFLIGHYDNLSNEPPSFLEPGIHGMGNCHTKTPWRKIPYGLTKFTEICQEYPKINNKDKLVEKLMELLSDDTRHFPDPQLEKQGKGKGNFLLEPLSALNVIVPEIQYGTRTNTVILIDKAGSVDYIERTMEEPIDALNPKWTVNHHQFVLESNLN